jgi:hypothetical protein
LTRCVKVARTETANERRTAFRKLRGTRDRIGHGLSPGG